MAFDAGMLLCALSEIRENCLGGRIEKVCQPERDEILLQIRGLDGGKKILISAGSNAPRISFTGEAKENPATPPMLCMLLRKHLQGAKLSSVRQADFERVAILEFDTHDEMGFPCKKKLITELMGKYSNLIFADESDKILAVTRAVDFSASGLRQVLPGMRYELPPKQNKKNPLEKSKEDFEILLIAADPDCPADKWIFANLCGVSSAVAREISFRASGSDDATIGRIGAKRLACTLSDFFDSLKSGTFSPTLVEKNGTPIEYAFCDLSHYGKDFTLKRYESAGALLDDFFREKDREQHIRQRAADLLKILSNADARIRKKLDLQRGELADCAHGEEYKRDADLITANLYQLSRGMTRAELTDYTDCRPDGSFGSVVITLDRRLSPAANAQRYYKKYNKSKSAKEELTKQIALGESELSYIDTVFDALSHAETASDLSEIREELKRSGYLSRKKGDPVQKKPTTPILAEYRTSGGMKVLCGKNNTQNEYLTHKIAGKSDYWFHAKNIAGSHVVLFTNGEEPSEKDFTEAAEIAAFFSKAEGAPHTEVDYTEVKNVKKPPASKPGLVIYHQNRSCTVSPVKEKIAAMRKK